MAVVALFGATGKTGRKVFDRLLAGGHEVRTLVRDPAKLGDYSGEVEVVTGDVLNAADVDLTVAGSDAVLSLFGHVKGSPRELLTPGTRWIVEAMKRHGVTRIVTLSIGGLHAEQDRPKTADKVIISVLKLMRGYVLADVEGHLAVLEESGLDWTVVRAPRLTDKPGRGTHRVGWVGVNASTQISRDDMADFIVTQVEDRRFIGQMPFVSD